MAKKVKAKNSIAEMLKKKGAGKAIAAHKNDETKISSGGNLPSGIEGGVAQLIVAKIDFYKSGALKDEPYLMLRGVVKAPIQYAGMQAMKMVQLCDDSDMSRQYAKSKDDQWGYALNELRKLGIATEDFTDPEEDTVAALEELQEEKPHFRFRTWSRDKKPGDKYEPRINVDFRGVCEWESDGEDPAETAVEDETEEAEVEEESTEEVEETVEEETVEEEVVEEGEEETEALVEVGDVYYYTPQKTAKNPKPKKVEVQIKEVNGDKVTITTVDKPIVTYKNIPVDKLQGSED